MRFSNIRGERGILANVGLGNLQVIDIAVSHIQHNGDLALSHALWEFAQTVLESREVEEATRREMIERLSFLSDQVLTSQGQKQPSVASAVLVDLGRTASSIPALAASWETLEPLLQQALS